MEELVFISQKLFIRIRNLPQSFGRIRLLILTIFEFSDAEFGEVDGGS